MSISDLTSIQMVPADATLRKIGLRAVAIISQRTLAGEGVDDNGNKVRLADYSESPFALPSGALTSKARSALKGRLHYFKSAKSGRLWVVVEGGYKAYKQARYPQDNGVNLSATGAMLRALTVTQAGQGTVQIGFTRQEEAQKAFWHNVTGVGKRRTVRRFMGLTQDERNELAAMAAETLTIKT